MAGFLFFPPGWLLPQDAAGWIGWILFVVVGLVAALLIQLLYRSRRRAEANAAAIDAARRQFAVVLSEERQRELARGRLAALVESSDDAIIGQTLEGVVTDWNPGAERLFGFSAKDAVGFPITETIADPEHMEQLLHVFERLKGGGRVDLLETVRRRKDGRRLPVSIRFSPIRDADGKVVGVSAIDRDITRQKNAERRRNARVAVTEILAHAKSSTQAASGLLEAVCRSLDWDAGCLWKLDKSAGLLRCQAFWHEPSGQFETLRQATEQLALAAGDGLPGRAWRNRQLVWLADVRPDPQFVRTTEAEQAGLHGGVACPVTAGQELWGVIEFFSRDIQHSDEDLIEMLTTIGGQLGQYLKRRQAEEASRKSEERFRALADNAPAAIFIKDLAGRYVLANPLACETLGRPEGVVGLTDHELLPADVADNLCRHDQEVIASGRSIEREEVVRRAAVEQLFLSVKFPLRNRQGQPEGVCGMAIDITDRKRAELALRTSERRFRTLADASASLSALVDYKSTLHKIARLAVATFSDSCAVDMVQTDGSLERLAVAHADPAETRFGNDLARYRLPSPTDVVLQTGRPEMVAEISDAKHEAGRQPILQLAGKSDVKSYICVPLTARGKILGALTFVTAESGRRYDREDLRVAQDLAHRATVAIENARLYQEVRDADRRKDEFLAMLAHELRNPLAPIRSGLDILAMEPGRHGVMVQSMQQQVEHLVRLVDDLLDVSRITRGRVELRKERVQLTTIVDNSVETVRRTVEEQGQELSVMVPKEAVWLDADPIRLTQVIENLLNNSCKFTDAGGRIELTAEQQPGHVIVRVRDTGRGIEPELLPKVFELFSQSSRSPDRSQGGLGIGLTLVKTLVELHGGTVSAHSQGAGKGSEFVLRLPTSKPADHTPAPEPEPTVSATRRILIVDDNLEAARMLGLLLSKLNAQHHVETAVDGPAALQKMGSHRPEIVLLDIGLPGMDGYHVAKNIRANPDQSGVLLVALTGYGQAEDRRKSHEAGFDEHLVKPPSLADLKSLLTHPKLGSSRKTASLARPLPPVLHGEGGVRAESRQASHARDSRGKFPDALQHEPAREFFQELAHEFGNVAYVIGLCTKILENHEAGLRDDARRILTELVPAVRELVRGLQRLGLVTGNMNMRRQHVELNSVIADAMRAVGRDVDDHVQLQCALAQDQPILEGDPSLLEQALVELLHNAARYTAPGGRISVQAEVNNGFAVVRVRDTGAGLSQELQQSAFQLFVRGEQRIDLSQGHLGIGLPLVRRIVEAHGGSVDAESEGPGKGTELVVRLPMSP